MRRSNLMMNVDEGMTHPYPSDWEVCACSSSNQKGKCSMDKNKTCPVSISLNTRKSGLQPFGVQNWQNFSRWSKNHQTVHQLCSSLRRWRHSLRNCRPPGQRSRVTRPVDWRVRFTQGFCGILIEFQTSNIHQSQRLYTKNVRNSTLSDQKTWTPI